jgi:hypothetical protein
MHSYKLKLTTLTPVHIGTGEDYEPTNFVIDGDRFYHFDEALFYKSLPLLDKKTFDSKLGDWMQIIDFYKTNTSKAISISKFSCYVSTTVSERYRMLKNKDGSKNNNSFQIAQTFKNPNTFRPIIPGSSIKGMLDTILQIYPQKIKENDERQKLILSDSLLVSGGTEIGYMRRGDRDKSKIIDKNGGISSIIEVIKENSEFIVSINTIYTFQELQEMIKNYHLKRENSMYSETNNSFVARIGKFSGMEYLVDDIKNAVQPKTGKPLGTHSLYDFKGTLKQFGWVKFELISDDEFQASLSEMKTQEIAYFDTLRENQRETVEAIAKAKEESRKLASEKAEKVRREQLEAEEKVRQVQARMASLSPLELKIDEHVQAEPNKGQAHYITILNALKKGDFDDFKIEALQWIKQQMVASGEWKETSNKPAKDKAHQRTLEIIKLLS